MNNQKGKGKKRKLTNLEESSEPDSSDKEEEEADSNSDEESQEGSGSDESASSTDTQSSKNSDVKSVRRLRTSRPTAILSDSSSESGDENSEKCAICLRSIVSQEVGNPEVCDHLFCSVCIIEWSKNSNVCPLDRQQFSIILVRANKDGNVVKKVPVEEPQAPRMENVELEAMNDTLCEICGYGDREDIMLLCDNCDRGFHTICLTPPLENIPDENEWFCPDCESSFTGPNGSTALAASGFDDFLENVSTRFRTLRPRVQMVRTRLLERIRVTVNRIVENYVLRHSDDPTEDEYLSDESDDSLFSLGSSFDHVLSDQPSTSGVQMLRSNEQKAENSNKKVKGTTTRRKTRKKTAGKKSTVGSRKKKTTTKRKTAGTTKRKSSKRKVKVKTTRTKKVKVENPDGTITEKIIKTRTYKRRKQKRRKKKIKSLKLGTRGLRVKSVTTPKTVKGRLALTLGMVPPKKPGQLLPDVRMKSSNSTSSIDLNRARAGIPKLHIFGPRDELQYFSSESDNEDIVIGGSGGVATVAQQRTNLPRLRERKKAALALQSMPPSNISKPKPVIEPPSNECVDILGSILDSQAIWHSKDTNTNVKINSDGSIEVIKKNKESDVVPKPEDNKITDVREGRSEGVITQAPMYPGSGNRAGGFRPNRNNYGESRNNQDNMFSSRGGRVQSGMSFNRFGGPARNDREGYTNYLNSMPQGPAPFCRGGPPLRFRMPPRQQLRRIPFPPRNRPNEPPEEEVDDKNEEDEKAEKTENAENKTSKAQEEEDDIDLYSDIETNADKTDSGPEDSGTNYPALGPPPEPPAFLLGLDENGEFGVTENKDKSEVYDPAEPCDSEDEMVIDENQERASTPEKKQEPETKSETTETEPPVREKTPPNEKSDEGKGSLSENDDNDDDDDEDCPIFSIYSSATREFSQKEEDERQREIAEDRRKLEEMKIQDEQKKSMLNTSVESSDQQNVIGVDNEKNAVDDVLKIELEENRDKMEEMDNSKNAVISSDLETKTKERTEPKSHRSEGKSLTSSSRSRSNSVETDKVEKISNSPDSEKARKSKSPDSLRDKSSSPDRNSEKFKRSKRRIRKFDTNSDGDDEKIERRRSSGDTSVKEDEYKERDKETELDGISKKVATGLEGLDVEEVSSDNGDAFADKRSLSSLSLSDLSQRSKRSRSPLPAKKKKKNRKRKMGRAKGGKNFEEGEIDDSEKDNRNNESFTSKAEKTEVGNENDFKSSEKRRARRSVSAGSGRQVLGSKENKKTVKEKSKERDLSWKKPSKKDKNYREGKKRSKDRSRSKSNERRKSKSPSPKKDKKKNKERKKKADKKKDIERYDVRKIVKNKELRKTDAFGRDIVSKSRSVSRSRSRTPIRDRNRNMLRRDSRSFSRSRSRSFRRGRSPIRRRYVRSRTRSRSKSIRRSYSRSRSRSRSRKVKKKPKAKDRLKARSRSRGRKSRSPSRSKRRSLTLSRSRSPVSRVVRNKKAVRSRKSWSHHASRSPSFSPRRSRSITRSPIRVRRSYSRSMSSSWSKGRSPLPRTSSLEKLTVVLTTKDKKKWKKKKEGKKIRKDEKRRKKTGNSKEVFASGDNVLVSVNFRNNSNTGGTNSGGLLNTDSRNTRLNSLSPDPGAELSRKKKRGSDYEAERVSKKSKKSNPISKKVVDVALSNACPKRAKKLTRLSEKDAEVILNRKPVAVIDLDMSPYREQTPSPVNVVVVSDSGSGDEGKEHTPPARPNVRGTPGREVDKLQEVVSNQSVSVSVPSSPVENGYMPTSGPKTPPEPQIKFSINKPQQLRPIANPLGDDDDDDDEVEEAETETRVESLDRRIEKELDSRAETLHKGPNTPPAPRGPSTPKDPPSPQTSPDAYDPFEPTKSRSPSPSQADKENRLSPKLDGKDDQVTGNAQGENVQTTLINVETAEKTNEVLAESSEEKAENSEKSESMPAVDCTSNVVIPPQASSVSVTDMIVNESPERKISVVISTPQGKTQPQAVQKPFAPVLKQLPMVPSASAVPPPTSASLTVSTDIFSALSPTKTSRTSTSTTQNMQVTGIQRLQHRLGSPVNRSTSTVKSTPEKRPAPRLEPNKVLTSGNFMIRNVSKRNGEPGKQPRPLQDATNETIDITMDMDDSPYSPASSEGDDLFDPPAEPTKPSQSSLKPMPSYKTVAKPPSRKSPTKQLSKFDMLFGPTLSPVKVGSKTKMTNTKTGVKPLTTTPKVLPPKPQKKSTVKKNIHKMDEDQLRILDDLPSSAVELQVKDKFLKKLNRQERVVDEVKTVLKPHYARKHITKEEYKDILRRSVPKICHSRSGEINPSKIQSLIEAYVRKFRHAKKKGIPNVAPAKPKVKKTMFS